MSICMLFPPISFKYFRSVCKLIQWGFSINTSFPWVQSSLSSSIYRLFTNENAAKSRRKERWKESRQEGRHGWQEEAITKKEGNLLDLHLQSHETSPPRHWYLKQGHVHHELLRSRCLRAYRRWSFPPCSLQQEVNHYISWDPNRCSSSSSRWIGQACRQWRHQSRHQIHQQQVNSLLFATNKTTALLGATTWIKRSWPNAICMPLLWKQLQRDFLNRNTLKFLLLKSSKYCNLDCTQIHKLITMKFVFSWFILSKCISVKYYNS